MFERRKIDSPSEFAICLDFLCTPVTDWHMKAQGSILDSLRKICVTLYATVDEVGKDYSGVQNEASKILLPLKSTMRNSERFKGA